MSTKRNFVAGISAAMILAASGVTGCGGDDDKDSGGTDKPANVAWITYAYSEYQQAEEKGLNNALKPEGGSVKIFNANFDPQKMQQQCQDAVTSGRYNVIMITPVTAPTGVPCVNTAKAAGIPVIQVEGVVGEDVDNLEPQVDGVVGTVAIPQSEPSRQMGKLVEKACADKNPCEVILDAIPGDPFGENFEKAVKAQPGVKVVQKINTGYDTNQMTKIAPDMFAAHPEVDVVVALADVVALAAVPAAKAAGLDGKVKLMGGGGSREVAKAIKEGNLVFGTLGSWPIQTGEAAGRMAVQVVNGEELDPRVVNGLEIDEPLVITKENVDQFKGEY